MALHGVSYINRNMFTCKFLSYVHMIETFIPINTTEIRLASALVHFDWNLILSFYEIKILNFSDAQNRNIVFCLRWIMRKLSCPTAFALNQRLQAFTMSWLDIAYFDETSRLLFFSCAMRWRKKENSKRNKINKCAQAKMNKIKTEIRLSCVPLTLHSAGEESGKFAECISIEHEYGKGGKIKYYSM